NRLMTRAAPPTQRVCGLMRLLLKRARCCLMIVEQHERLTEKHGRNDYFTHRGCSLSSKARRSVATVRSELFGVATFILLITGCCSTLFPPLRTVFTLQLCGVKRPFRNHHFPPGTDGVSPMPTLSRRASLVILALALASTAIAQDPSPPPRPLVPAAFTAATM